MQDALFSPAVVRNAAPIAESLKRVLPPSGLILEIASGSGEHAGAHTGPSNAAFDNSLRARNASWGVRDIEAVEAAGEALGLHLVERVAMPANNLSLIFRKAGRTSAAVGMSSP